MTEMVPAREDPRLCVTCEHMRRTKVRAYHGAEVAVPSRPFHCDLQACRSVVDGCASPCAEARSPSGACGVAGKFWQRAGLLDGER